MRHKPSEEEVKQTYLNRVNFLSLNLRRLNSHIFEEISRAIGMRSYLISDQAPPEEVPLEDALNDLKCSQAALEPELKRYNFLKDNAQENPRVQTPELFEHFKAMDAYISFAQQTLQEFYTFLEKHKEVLEEYTFSMRTPKTSFEITEEVEAEIRKILKEPTG